MSATALASRDACAALDRDDPLASQRLQFYLPEGVLYLDGNSLGALPRAVPERLRQVVEQQWARDLIRSWNQHGWIDLARRTGDKIAPLVGARPGQVMVADSTSVNLFKLLAAALDLQTRERPGRTVLLSERGNFPSDLYIMQGLSRLLGEQRCRVHLIDADSSGHPPSGESLRAALDEHRDAVAVVALTHVDFKTGGLHDMQAVTAAVHDAGGLMLWDLAHSAGALPVELDACDVDLAVGCGYKYLNGGPGAPAFLYVAERLQPQVQSPLSGWLGHEAPFAFDLDYRPADGIQRFICGTPPILSLAALDTALDVWDGVDLHAVRQKSMRLGDLFLRLVAERCADFDFETACPADAEQRGSQVCLRHPEGYAIVQALIARGVIGDFRAPDVLRFGFAPLYLRYVDIWDAVEALRQVMVEEEWRRDEFQQQAAVT